MKDLLVVLLLVLVTYFGASRSSFFRQANMPTTATNGLEVNGQGASDDTAAIGSAVSKKESKGTKTNTPATSSTVTEKTPPVSSNTAAGFPIKMSDVPAGDTVTVPWVSFDAPGWVAIREKGTNGQTFGTTLGATLVDKGTHTNVIVELLRPVLSGGTYFVVLHTDNGDYKYARATDPVVQVPGVGNAALEFRVK